MTFTNDIVFGIDDEIRKYSTKTFSTLPTNSLIKILIAETTMNILDGEHTVVDKWVVVMEHMCEKIFQAGSSNSIDRIWHVLVFDTQTSEMHFLNVCQLMHKR